MGVKIEEYVDIPKHAKQLGLKQPSKMAILPRNFESANSSGELFYESETATIRKLWKEAKLHEERLERDEHHFPYIRERTFEWFGPTIFIGSMLILNEPNTISLALNVIANYLTDFFRGSFQKPKIKFDIIVEKTNERKYQKINYEGDINGIESLFELIKKIANE